MKRNDETLPDTNSQEQKAEPSQTSTGQRIATGVNLTARGEPFLWTMGGALVFGIVMIAAFLLLILYNGIITFYPKSILKITLDSGRVVAGEPTRSEKYLPGPDVLNSMDSAARKKIEARNNVIRRTLYKTGNFDFYNEDFRWVSDYEIKAVEKPADIFMVERVEWGPFVGFIRSRGL